MKKGEAKRDELDDENIKNADMTEDMIKFALDCARKGMAKYAIEKDIAGYIKSEFDKAYSPNYPNWHCIVGKQFGSYVTHESKHYIYFYIGQISFLLFKYG